jgi:hypothetical protein
MDRRTAIIVTSTVALAILLGLAYVFGWFGDGAEAPPPAATTPAPTPGTSGATQR